MSLIIDGKVENIIKIRTNVFIRKEKRERERGR